MISKTFKNRVSVRDAESVLEITDTPAGIRITVREEDRIVSGWFNPVQGAGISLAILEAAGVPWNVDTALGRAAVELDKHVTTEAKRTAEARERAELEAEALELHNAFWAGLEENQIDSWDDERGNAKNSWVSAARRARELAKEATK